MRFADILTVASQQGGGAVAQTWALFTTGSTVSSASGDIVLTYTGSPADGDLFVAAISYRDTPNFTAGAGWTAGPAETSGDTNAGGIASVAMWWGVQAAGVAPVGSFTRTAGAVARGSIMIYRPSVGTLTKVTQSSATLGSAGTTASTGAVTTTLANQLIVTAVAGGASGNPSTFDAATDPTTASGASDTTTAPTAGTWIQRRVASSVSNGGLGYGIADALRATAGDTGAITCTTGSSRSAMACMVFTVS